MTDPYSAACRVARRLRDRGHEVYLAGGAVRDRLLGKEPLDYDLATSALPDEVERAFPRTIAVGKQFGVIVVLSEGHEFQVATFRSDGAYGDQRHPDSVRFTSAVEDVRRRDFTINGLLMDPVTGEVIDHVGGRADLEAGLIRTIGDPDERFAEDNLRILRAVRFAARLGFRLDDATTAAIRRRRRDAASPSAERIFGELDRMLCERSPSSAVELMESLDLLEVVLPELAATGAEAVEARLRPKEARSGDWAERRRLSLRLLRREDLALGLGWVLLLDGLSPGSVVAGARAARDLLTRLRASNQVREGVAGLLRLRDRLLFGRKLSRARARLLGAHPEMRRVLVYRERLDELQPSGRPKLEAASLATGSLPGPLLRGQELMAMGLAGPQIGRVVRRLRFLQLDGRLPDAEACRAWVASRRLVGGGSVDPQESA